MDHLRAIAYLPILITIGIVGAIRERRSEHRGVLPETTEQYLNRTYPNLVISDFWGDGTED